MQPQACLGARRSAPPPLTAAPATPPKSAAPASGPQPEHVSRGAGWAPRTPRLESRMADKAQEGEAERGRMARALLPAPGLTHTGDCTKFKPPSKKEKCFSFLLPFCCAGRRAETWSPFAPSFTDLRCPPLFGARERGLKAGSSEAPDWGLYSAARPRGRDRPPNPPPWLCVSLPIR